MRRTLPTFAALLLAVLPSAAYAWSHQGHMLITRLAALRIISDPAAPQGLRDFLKTNMPYSMDDCRDLAIKQVVGGDPKNLAGFDDVVTLPDRVGFVEPGKSALIDPYNAAEPKMHFMDMEWFAKDPTFKADFSNRPTLAEISRDLHDPRWQLAGFVPFRVEECFKKTSAAFSKAPVDNAEALHWAGYLAHYVEDCHQPQHSTVDFRSYSYLAGKVPGVHEIHTKTSTGADVVSYRADSPAINPHGDVEYQLFESDQEPLATFRNQYWTELTTRIDAKAKATPLSTEPPTTAPAPYDAFARAVELLSAGYEYLPAVGDGAQHAYASGKFDPTAFFAAPETVHGERMTILQLIADRNASAVLEVEATWRRAWAEAHRE